MRMEIKVHPKRHHIHIKRTTKSSSTTFMRKSPKFIVTEAYKPETTTTTTASIIDVNVAGIFKGNFSTRYYFFLICLFKFLQILRSLKFFRNNYQNTNLI